MTCNCNRPDCTAATHPRGLCPFRVVPDEPIVDTILRARDLIWRGSGGKLVAFAHVDDKSFQDELVRRGLVERVEPAPSLAWGPFDPQPQGCP